MISINHLSKKFGNLLAVDDLCLEVQAGEILGFLGPNGAGKTTSIRMICGLLKPDEGEILWGNQTETLRSQIGYCPQENIYWPRLTCSEQLVYMGQMYAVPSSEAEKRSHRLLEQLGLAEKRDVLAEKLSGGMKRRLNIALAIIHEPPILVLDEPESGLDPQSRVMVRELIKELSQTKTIILTTHNMDEAEKLADRVAIVDHGKLLKLDTLENLKRSIGDGDLLEITIENELDDKQMEKLRLALSPISKEVSFFENSLKVRAIDMLERMSEITTILDQQQVMLSSMQLRKNSLEDVFIHLTGRALRE